MRRAHDGLSKARLGLSFRACRSFMRAPTSRDEGVPRPLERDAHSGMPGLDYLSAGH
jgi:hypothetical protein